MPNQLQLYFETRQRRLKLQREADELEQQEKDILYELTKTYTTAQVDHKESGFRLKAVRKEVPLVTDWAATLEYVKTTGQVDLLQKRLTDSAVKARWDNGIDVPGVTRTSKYTVTITQE